MIEIRAGVVCKIMVFVYVTIYIYQESSMKSNGTMFFNH